MKQVYLLTGRPGVGKTRLIKQVVAEMPGKAGGFYTEELREDGARQGFRLVTLEGQSTVLASVNIKSPHRVSRYGVDVEGLERVGVAALERAAEENELVVIDEIGKMELSSERFREAVRKILSSGKKVLGTIMLAPHPWADTVKSRPEVRVVEVTRENHAQVLKELRKWLGIA